MIGIVVPDNPEVGFIVQKGDPEKILPRLNQGIKTLREMGVWDQITNAYVSGDLKKITACYAGARGLLEKGDLAGYAGKLDACMNAK